MLDTAENIARINDRGDMYTVGNNVYGHNIPVGGGLIASGYICNIKDKTGHYKELEKELEKKC